MINYENENYLKNIIRKYTPSHYLMENLTHDQFKLTRSIYNWASENYLMVNEITISGSNAKGTAITLGSDLDLFVSITDCLANKSLGDIYCSLADYLERKYRNVRKQNVSIRVTTNDHKIDIVPAKPHSGSYYNDHSLYLNKKKTWMQTNVQKQIDIVKSSGKIDEIKLIKIWRDLHHLEFPSIYLEMSVINALKGTVTYGIYPSFYKLLNYFKDDFLDTTIYDPANTNNILSELITFSEKQSIKSCAEKSLNESRLENIVW